MPSRDPMVEPNGTLSTSITCRGDSKRPSPQPNDNRNNTTNDNKELINLSQQLRVKQSALDRVLTDFIHAQAELETKAQLLAEREAQIANLEEMVAKMRTGSDSWEARTLEAEQRGADLKANLDRIQTERTIELQRCEQETWDAVREASLLRLEGAEKDFLIKELQRKHKDAQESAMLAGGDRRIVEAESETRIKELQGLVNFFKRNSEKNSKLVCELTEKIQELTRLGV
ncbi:hypothetical protein B0H67DRAFT_578366 [Lasiosphaeris hirsuta]|uniref:Uncharacterized protein n=1 Tax=Lasiosphaeris hirsuta TaxID=260670 RepID=A0AA40AER4_9PEZI|nr:hypothetical protein B0H67DRAFT_578366 [Lasiosphaeris hirsuta]